MGRMSCARAEQLVDELLDDGLDEPTREELDEHLRRCPTCRRFCRSASTVREVLAGDEPAPPSAAAVARMRERLEARLAAEERLAPPARSRLRLVAWGGLAAAAAVSALVLGIALGGRLARPDAPADEPVARGSEGETPAAAPEEPAPPERLEEPAARVAALLGSARVLREAGEVEATPGTALAEGDALSTGEAAVATVLLADGSRLALGPETTVALRSLGEEGTAVGLAAGWVACRVEPREPGRGFEVLAGETRVRVVGTVFSVSLAEGDEVEVRVERGRVSVAGAVGRAVAVEAGERGTFPEGEVRPMADRLAARDRALLEGELPPAPPERVAARMTLGDQFREAEAARSRGEHAEAARIYRRIADADRSGPSGGTALVSLGQLCLGPHGRPGEARRAFGEYLRRHPRGPMRQEALVGLMRAEAATGRPEAARDVARRYLEAYPRGRYAGRARALLEAE